MVKHLKLWIVVADGEHARIVAPREDGALQTHDRIDSKSAHLRSSDIGADHPGRVQESASAARHGAEPRTDPHEAAKERFARNLGAWLLQSSRQRRLRRTCARRAEPHSGRSARQPGQDGIGQAARRSRKGSDQDPGSRTATAPQRMGASSPPHTIGAAGAHSLAARSIKAHTAPRSRQPCEEDAGVELLGIQLA